MSADPPPEHRRRLGELIATFAMLGTIGFGGPAAHIALMRREVVERRRWLRDDELVDLIGLTSIIPGPNSSELAMLVGQRRAGALGLVVAGLAFILPAATIVLALAWTYVTWGETPAVESILYGVGPVVVAIVAAALIAFARTALAGPVRVVLALGSAALWLLGVNELVILAASGLVMALARMGIGPRLRSAAVALPIAGGTAASLASVDLGTLGLVFLKAGALLFGSGYVLLAYLRGDLVDRLGWLTDAQLLDAVAIGQVTPGPLFTTATFIGYLLAGLPGAVVATVAIFAPAFVFAALVGRAAARVRHHALGAALLDGVNASAVGLMAAVSLQLGSAAIVDPLTAALALGAGAVLLWGRIPSVVLVAAGAAVGLASGALDIGP